MIEYSGDNAYDLDNGFKLAQVASRNGETFRTGDGPQAADQELASDDNGSDPRFNNVRVVLDQGDESGSDKQLVSQRVKQRTECSDLAVLACQVAIDSVSDKGKQEEGGYE